MSALDGGRAQQKKQYITGADEEDTFIWLTAVVGSGHAFPPPGMEKHRQGCSRWLGCQTAVGLRQDMV